MTEIQSLYQFDPVELLFVSQCLSASYYSAGLHWISTIYEPTTTLNKSINKKKTKSEIHLHAQPASNIRGASVNILDPNWFYRDSISSLNENHTCSLYKALQGNRALYLNIFLFQTPEHKHTSEVEKFNVIPEIHDIWQARSVKVYWISF